jgi:hypothetical protein
MYNLKKKAISDVIATVLLISIAIAGAIILGLFAIPFLKENANFSPAVSCLELKGIPPIKIQNACFNDKTKDIELILSRDLKDIEVSSLLFAIRSGAKSLSFEISPHCPSCQMLEKGEEKKYFFSFADFDGSANVAYSINNCLIKTEQVNRFC